MLKPIDIHNAEFKRSFKGYNEEEVDAFLARIVSEYENLYQQNKDLQQRIAQLEQELKQYKNKESDIYGLITLTRETVAEAKEVATQHSQAIIDEATMKAKVIIDEAKLKAKQILNDSQAQLAQVQQRVSELRRIEKEFKESMRRVMESTWSIIDSGLKDIEPDESGVTKVYREIAANLDLEDSSAT